MTSHSDVQVRQPVGSLLWRASALWIYCYIIDNKKGRLLCRLTQWRIGKKNSQCSAEQVPNGTSLEPGDLPQGRGWTSAVCWWPAGAPSARRSWWRVGPAGRTAPRSRSCSRSSRGPGEARGRSTRLTGGAGEHKRHHATRSLADQLSREETRGNKLCFPILF